MSLAWDNLTKFLRYAGWHGREPRVKLTLWRFGQFALVGLGVFVAASPTRFEPWPIFALSSLLGGIAGGVLAFFLHEVVFQWYVVTVCRIRVADIGDVVGDARAAIAT